MVAIRVQEAASHRIDAIYRHTRERLGRQRAELYVGGLFEAFGKIEAHAVSSRPVPAEFGVDGYVFHHERHFIYWRRLDNGGIGIVTVLPERMHRMDRFREDSGF